MPELHATVIAATATGTPVAVARSHAPALWRLPALLAGSLLGAALQLQQPVLWHWHGYALLLACAVALWGLSGLLVRSGGIRRWLCQLLVACAGAALLFATTGLRATVYLQGALDPALEGQNIRVIGTIAAMPQVNEAGVRLRLEVESAWLPGEGAGAARKPVQLPERMDVSWYGGFFFGATSATTTVRPLEPQRRPPALHAGERWEMTIRPRAPHGLSNPHGFDYELWTWEQGVQATGTVRTGPKDLAPVRLASTWQYPVEQARQSVRDAILARLAPGLDPDDPGRARMAGEVAALVTGDQRAIDRADWDVFRATGVAHLMSISGLHITLFAWLAALLVGALWRRSPRLCLAVPAPTAALVAGVLLAAAYALFSGWGVPAQRTVTMLATVALLQLSGRRWPWPQVWLLACAAVVWVDPWALYQAGFWLSFVAVAVLFATDTRAVGGAPPNGRARVLALLREQWVVTLALTPLSLLLFGQVSLVGFVANLVAIPWVTLVVTPLALGGVLCVPLWSLALWSLQPLSALLQWLATWPMAVLYLPVAPLWAGAEALAGGVLLAMRLPWRLRLLALPLVLPVLWWQPGRPAPGQFELLAADIGQGNAVLVRTASHTLLYDAGPRFSLESDAGHRVLVPLLRALGERVDVLMLSHRDADHTGGAAAVLAQQPGARLTGSIEAGHELQALRPATPCLAGQRWEWDGVAFEVLHPAPGDSGAAVRANHISCVLRIVAGGEQAAVALLAGDIETGQEQALVARGVPLKADVLLVPHHGSKTSSTGAFLDAVAPRTALVQAGYRNRFGHPASEVVARYQARGIAVVESARCGAATWSSAQPQGVACQRESGQRYWQHGMVPALSR
ncbi:DNA internalization-related competence protein ComEC/Rec2 [Acidovorax sp. A1169]|nr:DNA internalization-related competence protein ComEC/Rec2 [Acidovorax sp. A1169]